jgi:hypothetical protein
MSYESNISVYIKLIKEFCQNGISAEQFKEKYFELWSNDRDEQYSKTIDIWSRRYDIELSRELESGKISGDEFIIKQHELFGVTLIMSRICNVLDRIFTACNCFYSDISDEELNPPIEINGDMLKEEVKPLLLELEEILKDTKT